MTETLLEKINSIEGVVGSLYYGGATLSKTERKLSVVFNSSNAQERDLPERIENLLRHLLPQSFKKIEVSVRKIVTRPEFVERAILDYIEKNNKIVSSSVSEGQIEVTKGGGDVFYHFSKTW